MSRSKMQNLRHMRNAIALDTQVAPPPRCPTANAGCIGPGGCLMCPGCTELRKAQLAAEGRR